MSTTGCLAALDPAHHLGLCFHIASNSAKRVGMDPDDLRQEIALALVKAAPSFDPVKGKVPSFIGGVAKHVILKILKRRRSRRCPPLTQPDQDEEVWDPIDPRAVKPEARVEGKEDRERIEHLLAALTERERHVVMLYFGLGDTPQLTMQQIGELLGVTGSRVGQIIQTALDRLRVYARVPGSLADVPATS